MSLSLIEKHESWDTYDSSKIVQWLKCRRKFFWSYRMGWKRTNESIDLVHGDCIHRGMEQLFQAYNDTGSYSNGYSRAMQEYTKQYQKRYPNIDDWMFNIPKNPEGAEECFTQYPLYYHDDKFELIGIEIYGEIPVSDKHVLLGKLDTIIKTSDGKIYIVDHKTSKNRLTDIMREGHETCFQFRTYNLIGLYYITSLGLDPKDFGGVLVNHITFLNSKKLGLTCEFARFYVQKTNEQLERHIIEADRLISDIEEEDQRLLNITKLEEHFPLYTPNYGSCFDFWKKCEFFDLCHFHNNPLKFALESEVQVGYKKEFWNPRGEEDGEE